MFVGFGVFELSVCMLWRCLLVHVPFHALMLLTQPHPCQLTLPIACHQADTMLLHEAAAGGHIEMATWLVERGARLDARDRVCGVYSILSHPSLIPIYSLYIGCHPYCSWGVCERGCVLICVWHFTPVHPHTLTT